MRDFGAGLHVDTLDFVRFFSQTNTHTNLKQYCKNYFVEEEVEW